MAEDKQWFWTKVAGAGLLLFTLISSAVGVANMHFSLKRDVLRNEKDISEHKVDDEKAWDKVWDSVKSNEESIHAIELQSSRNETHYAEIIRRLDSMDRKLESFEVIE